MNLWWIHYTKKLRNKCLASVIVVFTKENNADGSRYQSEMYIYIMYNFCKYSSDRSFVLKAGFKVTDGNRMWEGMIGIYLFILWPTSRSKIFIWIYQNRENLSPKQVFFH